MRQPERLYLQDILEARDAIQRFLNRTDEMAFMLRCIDPVRYPVEAHRCDRQSRRAPPSFAERHPEMERMDIGAFRNITVHTAVDSRIG